MKKFPRAKKLLKLEELRRKLEFELRTEEMKRDLDPLSPEQSEMLKALRKRGIKNLKHRNAE